ncbi:MAG: phage terminase large subunit [Anaerolineae bacterium]|nr:phage terminase large subunit [Anaerolineae bacterium]
MAISDQEAARELYSRRQARAQFIDFTTYTDPIYRAEPFHELIASHLDLVVAGEITRLMIFAPPQHGKSRLVSEGFPAYWLGKRPDEPVIIASYGADLAYAKSRQARTLVESADYLNLFPTVGTHEDSRAVNRWMLNPPNRGSLLAVGVGGPVTGHGAMLGVIDDPFENWKQAQSPTIRDTVWEWYRTTFRTRIWEGGIIVLIMTRWHEDDLAGRILQQQGDQWTVLRLPAIAETQEQRDQNNKYLGLPLGEADPLGRAPGEPLAPNLYSINALVELRTDVGSAAWASEYQGVPRAPEGNQFKRDWFEIVEAGPAVAQRVRYWDKAGTEGGGAYTAGVLMAKAGHYFVEDVVRGQWSSLQRERIIRQTAELDRQRYGHVVNWVEQEPGSGGKESAENTIRNLAGFVIKAEPVTGNKDVRLQPFAAQAEALNVKLVRGPWNSDYIEELIALPNGYRDQSDASGGAFNKLHVPVQTVSHGRAKGVWKKPKGRSRPS